jgi:hypothetical protein
VGIGQAATAHLHKWNFARDTTDPRIFATRGLGAMCGALLGLVFMLAVAGGFHAQWVGNAGGELIGRHRSRSARWDAGIAHPATSEVAPASSMG